MLIGSICTVNLQLLKQYYKYNMPNKVSLDNYGKSKSSERLGKLANYILHWLFMAQISNQEAYFILSNLLLSTEIKQIEYWDDKIK